MNLLKAKEPFSFARFNDGEMKGAMRVGAKVARGDQIVSEELNRKLNEALVHEQKNYWKGKPCRRCFSKCRRYFDAVVPETYPYLTYAVLFCNNGHWPRFIEDFKNHAQGRKIVWVSGKDQKLDYIRNTMCLDVVKRIKLEPRDSWKQYHEIKDKIYDFPEEALVVLSCGPTSRVLAAEWFKARPDCTLIDAGSTFDPYTRNVWHRCHRGTLPRCPECHKKE